MQPFREGLLEEEVNSEEFHNQFFYGRIERYDSSQLWQQTLIETFKG